MDKVIVLRCTDARTVRPYIPVIVKLIRKIVEMANYANACRDAGSVRPFQQSRDLLSIPLERTHEPCVPTFQSHPFHRVIPPISRANMADMTYIAHQINFFMWPYSPSVAVFNDMNGYKIYLGTEWNP